MRLDQAFSDSFTRFPDSPAIIEGNRACTYSQLHARVESLAGALASRGETTWSTSAQTRRSSPS